MTECVVCGNQYLAWRTDIYKDGRRFLYCDICGSLQDFKTLQEWNKKLDGLSVETQIAEKQMVKEKPDGYILNSGHGIHVNLGEIRPSDFVWNGEMAWKPFKFLNKGD